MERKEEGGDKIRRGGREGKERDGRERGKRMPLIQGGEGGMDEGETRIRYRQLMPSVLRDAHKLISSLTLLRVQVRVQPRENARYFTRCECPCNTSEDGAASSPPAPPIKSEELQRRRGTRRCGENAASECI